MMSVKDLLKENPIYSERNSINTGIGTLSVSYTIHARNINMKPVGRNKLSLSANAIINGSLKYGFVSSPYSGTADLGIDASLSIDPSCGNLRIHFTLTSISNINTQSFGFSNIILYTISNNLSHSIIKLLPQYDIGIFTIPTKMHIGLAVTMTLSNIEYNEFNKYNGIIITVDVSFQK